MVLYTKAAEGNSGCEYDANVELLRSISIFRELPLDVIRSYAYLCERVRYMEGEYIFRQDERDSNAYIVVSGVLEAVREVEGQVHSCKRYSAGEFLGSLALLAETRRLFSVRAAEPTVCLVLPRKKLLVDIQSAPEVAMRFMQALCQAVVEWEENILRNTPCCKEDSPEVGVSLI
ncbi:cyclic nucleotide-binding domain-containing protein [Oleidesulfovibrio sp.]|uniref:cyclic nucleotide-binding domain-containing protein n=1 Tax=Oleidesulfovibrio sp. TaxID=2909707 RepID=UPI003A85C2E4